MCLSWEILLNIHRIFFSAWTYCYCTLIFLHIVYHKVDTIYVYVHTYISICMFRILLNIRTITVRKTWIRQQPNFINILPQYKKYLKVSIFDIKSDFDNRHILIAVLLYLYINRYSVSGRRIVIVIYSKLSCNTKLNMNCNKMQCRY